MRRRWDGKRWDGGGGGLHLLYVKIWTCRFMSLLILFLASPLCLQTLTSMFTLPNMRSVGEGFGHHDNTPCRCTFCMRS